MTEGISGPFTLEELMAHLEELVEQDANEPPDPRGWWLPGRGYTRRRVETVSVKPELL
jgi:hypothetical protein